MEDLRNLPRDISVPDSGDKELQDKLRPIVQTYLAQVSTPELINHTWQNIWTLIGDTVGYSYRVPSCDRTTQELADLRSENREVLLLPDDIYTTEGFVRLGKAFPLMRSWVTSLQSVARISHIADFGGCLDIEMDLQAPYRTPIGYSQKELIDKVTADTRFGQRIPTYIVGSEFSYLITGHYFDENTWSRLPGSFSRNYMLDARFHLDGNLYVGLWDPQARRSDVGGRSENAKGNIKISTTEEEKDKKTENSPAAILSEAEEDLAETDLLSKATVLQKDAFIVMDQLALRENLSQLGNPRLIGSVKNGLMMRRDIDFEVNVDEYRFGDYIDFMHRYAGMSDIVSASFSEFSVKIRKFHTKGASIQLYFQDYKHYGWKIEIWFIDFVTPPRSYEVLLENATRSEKESILNIKARMQRNPLYNNYIVSVDIYKAVLEGNVTNFEEFGAYMEMQGKDITLKEPPAQFKPS